MSGTLLAQLIALCLPPLPLVVAGALYATPRGRRALGLAPWMPLTALPLLALHGSVVELPWLLLGTRVGVDDLSAPLLLLAAIGWALSGWHGRQHIAADDQRRFFALWLLTWTGNLCVFITLDAASFYAAFTMMSLSAYGLVVFYRRPEDYRAGRIYLVMALLGDALILAALLWLGQGVGNAALGTGGVGVEALDHAGIAAWLFLGGFAVKMGVVPLHLWLPLAHPQAPVAASAVLSGVILKAGLMGWLRFLPLGEAGFEAMGQALLALGLLTGFFGVLVGLCQFQVKSLLAYSSVSQMGLISAAIGAALAYPSQASTLAWVAALFGLHHGLAKAALFLSVDVVKSAGPVVRALRWVPALSLAGTPLTSGALAKVSLKGAWPPAIEQLEQLVVATSVATTLLMARYLVLTGKNGEAGAMPRGEWHWPALILASLTLPWLMGWASGATDALRPFRWNYLMETTGPVAAGLAIAAAAWRWWPGRFSPAIPAGDLVTLIRPVPLPALALPRLSALRLPGPVREFQSRWEGGLGDLHPALIIWLAALGLVYLAWFL